MSLPEHCLPNDIGSFDNISRSSYYVAKTSRGWIATGVQKNGITMYRRKTKQSINNYSHSCNIFVGMTANCIRLRSFWRGRMRSPFAITTSRSPKVVIPASSHRGLKNRVGVQRGLVALMSRGSLKFGWTTPLKSRYVLAVVAP